jgi:hypothetical protein
VNSKSYATFILVLNECLTKTQSAMAKKAKKKAKKAAKKKK